MTSASPRYGKRGGGSLCGLAILSVYLFPVPALRPPVSDCQARVLFVSESGVCRSVLALSAMQRLLTQHGLTDCVECDAKVCGAGVEGVGASQGCVCI